MTTYTDEKRPVPPVPDAKDANALYHDTRAPASPPPMPPRPRDGAVADNATRGHSRTSSVDPDAHLLTILFAIPFPAVTKGSTHKDPISPYLLYALPRAPYEKPAVDEDGKKLEKEGLVKKAERKWQEEIAEGEKIRKGQDPDAGNWKKFKGKAVGAADKVIHWLPNSRIEALGRVPPKRKLGELTVLYPDNVPGPNGQPITPQEVQAKLEAVLKETQKSATVNAVGSACLLPVTLTIDFFAVVPIFLFEMNLAYFSTQVSGRSKVSAITSSPSAFIPTGTPYLTPVSILLHETCHDASPKHFSYPNGVPMGKGVSQQTLLNAADALIGSFLEHSTEQVQERHILDREKVAEDLKRCCVKASKEYVKRVA